MRSIGIHYHLMSVLGMMFRRFSPPTSLLAFMEGQKLGPRSEAADGSYASDGDVDGDVDVVSHLYTVLVRHVSPLKHHIILLQRRVCERLWSSMNCCSSQLKESATSATRLALRFIRHHEFTWGPVLRRKAADHLTSNYSSPIT